MLQNRDFVAQSHRLYVVWQPLGDNVTPLGPKEKKSPADKAYDCRGISGPSTAAYRLA